MGSAVDFLWRLNQEYGSRLTRARSYLDLLEPLVFERGAPDDVLTLLAHMRAHLDVLRDDHHAWRYTYYYDSADTKRVVQSPAAVRRALLSFSKMRAAQEAQLNELTSTLYNFPRPEPVITNVPNGDLWELLYAAVHDLVTFTGDLIDAV